VTAGEDSTARVWSRHSGAELAVFRGHDGALEGAHFLGAGNRVFTAGADGTGRVWDPGVIVLPGDRDVLEDARFSPDGRTVATAGFDGTKLWTARGRQRATLRWADGSSHTAVAFSPDGQRLLIDQDIDSLWSITGRRLRTFDGLDADYAVFSPDSKLVAAGASSAVALIDARTGRDAGTLKVGRRTAVFQPAFSGHRVAAPGSLTGAHVWDLQSRKRTHDLREVEGIEAVVFAPDGKHLVTSGDQTKAVRIWDLETRQNVVLDTYPTGVRDLSYSPDGALIATVSYGERRVRVHDAETRRRLAVLVQENEAFAAGFSPDSRLLLVLSNQEAAQLWEARTGRLVSTLTGHTDSISSARFSPDGRRTITSSADGTAVIRNCDECLGFEKLVALARGRVTPLSAGQ
jgi:WD40 repeat protein